MPNPTDPWETESIVPFNDGDVTFVDAYFEEGTYGIQLVVVNRVDIPRDPVEYPAATFNQWFSTGKDWVVMDGGARITKPDASPDKPSKIHASSNLGKLMDRVAKELKVNMRDRGLPTEARVWKDLRFAVLREAVKYSGLPAKEGSGQPPGTTVDLETTILLPVRLLGALGSEAPAVNPSPAPAAAPAAPTAIPSQPVTATPLAASGAPAATATSSEEQHLLSIVVGKGSVVEAKTAAMRDEQVATNDALTDRILEHQLIESYFESGVLVMVDGKIALSG